MLNENRGVGDGLNAKVSKDLETLKSVANERCNTVIRNSDEAYELFNKIHDAVEAAPLDQPRVLLNLDEVKKIKNLLFNIHHDAAYLKGYSR